MATEFKNDGTDEIGYKRDKQDWWDHSPKKSITIAYVTDEDN